MTSATVRRSGAILVSAMLLASLALAMTSAAAAEARCKGRRATIVGTNDGEVIEGTPKVDVIVARGGNDIIYGRGGHDIICGGFGNDRLVGGAGKDWLKGEHGEDTLLGGGGEDWLRGGAGPDRLLGGAGHDDLDGGYGEDVCRAGPGSGPLDRCEDVPAVTPRNLAIAFSDLDDDDRYGPGDILISRLFDTNGDGIPSKGDTISMGQYPTDFGMTAFADWTVDSHTVEEADSTDLWSLSVFTNDGWHWWENFSGESYAEHLTAFTTRSSHITDAGALGYPDTIVMDPESPSRPVTPTDQGRAGRTRDDPFIDVVVWP
jgi:hypothetical protein